MASSTRRPNEKPQRRSPVGRCGFSFGLRVEDAILNGMVKIQISSDPVHGQQPFTSLKSQNRFDHGRLSRLTEDFAMQRHEPVVFVQQNQTTIPRSCCVIARSLEFHGMYPHHQSLANQGHKTTANLIALDMFGRAKTSTNTTRPPMRSKPRRTTTRHTAHGGRLPPSAATRFRGMAWTNTACSW